MASSFVALIRGINVGRAKRVTMADLRALMSDLGYSEVRTLLNSGNAVFSAAETTTAADAASRIEGALAASLGVETRVIVIGKTALAEAVAGNPLEDIADDPSHLLVAFLADPRDRTRLVQVAAQDWSPEAIAVGRRVAYLWCPAGVADSCLSRALGKALGDAVTARNWTTVLKLVTLVEALP